MTALISSSLKVVSIAAVCWASTSRRAMVNLLGVVSIDVNNGQVKAPGEVTSIIGRSSVLRQSSKTDLVVRNQMNRSTRSETGQSV